MLVHSSNETITSICSIYVHILINTMHINNTDCWSRQWNLKSRHRHELLKFCFEFNSSLTSKIISVCMSVRRCWCWCRVFLRIFYLFAIIHKMIPNRATNSEIISKWILWKWIHLFHSSLCVFCRKIQDSFWEYFIAATRKLGIAVKTL